MGDVSECLDYCRRVFGDLPGGWYRLQIEATEARFLEMSTGMATDFEPAVYPFFELLGSSDAEELRLVPLMNSSWNQVMEEMEEFLRLKDLQGV